MPDVLLRSSSRRMSLVTLLLAALSAAPPAQFSAMAFTAPSAAAPVDSTLRQQCRAVATSALFAADDARGGVETATEASKPAVEEGDDDSGLTAQERVLRSLGVEPESEEDRTKRISSRLAAEEEERNKKRTNAAVAVLAFAAALFNYGWRVTHPVTAVEILAQMQSQSDPLTVIGRNDRPTVVDFWAPWCENCRYAAPTLRSVEREYGDRVNFIMINGDDPDAWPVIERFGVDAIPHLAMVSREGDVETALIGPIPRSVLRADIDALLEREEGRVQPKLVVVDGTGEDGDDLAPTQEEGGKPLPYVMYDAFRSRPEMRRVQFEN